MLNATLIIFSRTLTNDYRWIYSDNKMEYDDKKDIMIDYQQFERNREFYLHNNHLVVRYLQNGISIYKFFETGSKDQDSRKIYAIAGRFFTGFDYELVNDLLKYIALFFLCETENFETYSNIISDDVEDVAKPIIYKLDFIIDKVKKYKSIGKLAQDIFMFIAQHPNKGFIIINNCIMPLNEKKELQKSHNSFEPTIDDMLNSIKNCQNSEKVVSTDKNNLKRKENKGFLHSYLESIYNMINGKCTTNEENN